ncbi:MAG: DUF2202 domain-containing protein [Thiomonas sp.]
MNQTTQQVSFGAQGRCCGSGMGRGCGMGGGGRGRQRDGARAAAVGAERELSDRSAHRAQHIAQLRSAIAASPRTPLSRAEEEDLLLMREEEKIARDVYLRLYERWGIRPFGNISGAEQAHMDAMLALLDHYGLPDPARNLPVGQFRRTDLQALYARLIEQGMRSEADAVRVGLLVEELDIADLQQAAARTDKAAIRAVYAELERGSRNHLRAFYRWKQHRGAEYTPQHLPAAEFERIASSPHESCE